MKVIDKYAWLVLCCCATFGCAAGGARTDNHAIDETYDVNDASAGIDATVDAVQPSFNVSAYWSANSNAPMKKVGREDSAPWLLTQFLADDRTWTTNDGYTQTSDHDYWEKSLPDLALYDVWHFNIDRATGNVQEVADTYPQDGGTTYDVVFPAPLPPATSETTLVWGPAAAIHVGDAWENSTYYEDAGQGSWGYQKAQLVEAFDVWTIPNVDLCQARTVRDVIKISEVQGYGSTWYRTDIYVSANWGFVQRDYFAPQTAPSMPSSGWVQSSSAYMDWSQKLDGSWACLADP